MLANILLFLFTMLFSMQSTLADSADVDLRSMYAPDPPATNRISMTISYFPKGSDVKKEVDFSIDVYGTVCPKARDNFITLIRGIKAVIEGRGSGVMTLRYPGTKFTNVLPNKYILGGEILPGISPYSIYGDKWPEENFDLKFDRPGRIAMWNHGQGKQESQFFISTNPKPDTELDGKYSIFGQVVSGLDVILNEVQHAEVSSTKDMILKYMVKEDLRLAKPDELHAKWLKRLEEYNNGDKTKGVSIARYFKAEETAAIPKKMPANALYNGYVRHSGFPLFKVFFILVSLAVCFYVFKHRAEFLKRTNIVSLKQWRSVPETKA